MIFSKNTIALSNTNLFSNLFLDYISANENVKEFYSHHIFKSHFDDFFKSHTFNNLNRELLVVALQSQTDLVENTHELSKKNITALLNANVYTITTGHQLCLFTGPLYFIYKIVSTINLAKTLQEQFPEKQFVPVYWMASEDHDFEEINNAHVFGKKVSWQSEQKGAVGDFKTEELQSTINELKLILGESEHAQQLILLFENAYIKHNNLADATRFLVNELFGEHGIVILDGNDKALKSLFKEEFKADIFDNKSINAVTPSIEKLSLNYSIQVKPRDINVFYKVNGLRERIEKKVGDVFQVVNSDITFSKSDLENLIETTSENLSPNVVLRPLYQQKILPNVAYVGGPGELAYWLEFKNLFKEFGITFPILMPRQFITIVDKNTQQKMKKFELSIDDLFKEGELLVKEFIKTQQGDVNLSTTKEQLVKIYESLAETIVSIDKTLVATAEAEKQKALNGIAVVEQKINKSFKQKAETEVNQLWAVKEKIFPNGSPQERFDNFSMYYIKYGKDFIPELMNQLTYNLSDFEYTVLLEN